MNIEPFQIGNLQIYQTDRVGLIFYVQCRGLDMIRRINFQLFLFELN